MAPDASSQPDAGPVIRLREISRVYRMGEQEVHALRDIHEEIASGEHVAIMGPSGSGKSTLLNILGCLDRPSSGVYELDGEDVASMGDRELTAIRRHRIGFVFQFFHLVPRLTAAENVGLPMLFAGIAPRERRRRIAEALDAVGLSHRAHHRPDELSGGERQRVALARATVMEPSIVLADEPTGNLDTGSGRVVLDLLERMNAGGLTLIVVTHDPKVARRADRILLLMDGSIVRRVPGEEIGSILPLLTEEDAPEEAAGGGGAQ